MKINDSNRINGVSKVYQVQNEYRKGDSRKVRTKDEVQISQAAQKMLNNSRAEQSERTAYINQLKESVRTGTYHVEAGKIAEKLLPYLK